MLTRRYEVSTSALDTTLQGVGGDPYGSPYFMGLRVPIIPSPNLPAYQNRYLFLLAKASFGPKQRFRVVGMRQFASIGALVPNQDGGCNYPVELPIESPVWHFSDANISWHLRRVGPMRLNTNNPAENKDSQIYLYGDRPGLLVLDSPSDVGGYVPPNGGQPFGTSMMPDLGTFHDLRFPWNGTQSWFSLDFEGEGPCDIALFASVQQSDIDNRCRLTGDPSPFTPKEDAFVQLYTQAVYWRVAGSLIFENIP